MRALNLTVAAASLLAALPTPAFAWGDEGHKAIAAIADHFLTPAVRQKVHAMLEADPDSLTAHDIASAATWADRYRDSDRGTTKQRYNATHLWHFVDIETSGAKAGDVFSACFHEPKIPSGTPVSQGPARDCIYNKIGAFSVELADPKVPAAEKTVALKFLLHLVGDIHQPLHTADNHNSGGNAVRVKARGSRVGTFHHYWDVELVERTDPGAARGDFQRLSETLIKGISTKEVSAWSRGTAKDWALESYAIVKGDPIMALPKAEFQRTHELPDAYVEAATKQTREQLQKAGVRLAAVLNEALR